MGLAITKTMVIFQRTPP